MHMQAIFSSMPLNMTWEGLQSLPQRQRRSRPPDSDQIEQDTHSERQPSVHVGGGDDDLHLVNADDGRETLRSSAENGCSYECKTLFSYTVLLGSWEVDLHIASQLASDGRPKPYRCVQIWTTLQMYSSMHVCLPISSPSQ